MYVIINGKEYIQSEMIETGLGKTSIYVSKKDAFLKTRNNELVPCNVLRRYPNQLIVKIRGSNYYIYELENPPKLIVEEIKFLKLLSDGSSMFMFKKPKLGIMNDYYYHVQNDGTEQVRAKVVAKKIAQEIENSYKEASEKQSNE